MNDMLKAMEELGLELVDNKIVSKLNGMSIEEIESMLKNKPKMILVVGPTASGKTALSIELAKHFNAEIVNADARYIYKEPIIATAKVTKEEMSNIPHHMIDLISLNDDYSIYDFQKEGRKVINSLLSNGKNVIVVGGSGLYVKALLYDYQLKETVKSNMDFSALSSEELKSKIDEIDPENEIHINNRKRMERFLSHYYESGDTIKKTESINSPVYDFITIGLNSDRNELYDRINSRVDYMFDNGLLEEAKSLKDFKHFNEVIGYRELTSYFNNEITLEDAKNSIKQDTRHLAKRQVTWFKNQMNDINWIDVNYNNFNETINKIISSLDDYYKEKQS